MPKKPLTLDTRPVHGDPGMSDAPLPRLNPYAREVIASVLEPMHVPYSVSAGEHQVTVLSPMAWLSIISWFGRFFERPIVPIVGRLSVDGTRAEEISFTVSRGPDYLRIRIAGDGANVLGRFGREARAITRLKDERPGVMGWNTAARLDLQALGQAYAELDPAYNDQASPRL